MSRPPPTPPAEWSRHAAIWTAWPADPEIWPGAFEAARAEVAGLVRALAADGPGGAPGDRVKVLAMGAQALESARQSVGDVAELVAADYGDIWLRDTAPVFLSERSCALFRFNGWGGKYIYDHDDAVGDFIARAAGAEARRIAFTLEGGSIDWDGEGTVLTTRECLLNPNRNAGIDEPMAERRLRDSLGFEQVVWIDGGLANDHTDGHVDNIARFLAPGVVACQSPTGADDPNAERLEEIARTLSAARDAKRRRLEVVRLPSPGRVTGPDGEVVPASHMNFLIGNGCVAMPTYGETDAAARALAILQQAFPDRRVLGLPAESILSGGGAFHCITQQQPAD
jgi:agmatine deiminase